MRFAENTTVPIEKSQSEIQACVRKYGANGFISGWLGNDAMISFEVKNRRIRFLLPLPDKNEKRFTHYERGRTFKTTYVRSAEAAHAAWEQSCRQKWRALSLAVKAKLEAVESGIASFEEEFLAYVVMADGRTLGEAMIPSMNEICSTSKLPRLLPAPPDDPAMASA